MLFYSIKNTYNFRSNISRVWIIKNLFIKIHLYNKPRFCTLNKINNASIYIYIYIHQYYLNYYHLAYKLFTSHHLILKKHINIFLHFVS